HLCYFFLHSQMSSLYHAYYFFYSSGARRDLHSFPTRRSSDLSKASSPDHIHGRVLPYRSSPPTDPVRLLLCLPHKRTRHGAEIRSEEHTSELQSRFDIVCRLLLEKKKQTSTTANSRPNKLYTL